MSLSICFCSVLSLYPQITGLVVKHMHLVGELGLDLRLSQASDFYKTGILVATLSHLQHHGVSVRTYWPGIMGSVLRLTGLAS